MCSTCPCCWPSPPSAAPGSDLIVYQNNLPNHHFDQVMLSPYQFKYLQSICAYIILVQMPSHLDTNILSCDTDVTIILSYQQAVFYLLVQPFTLNRSFTYISTFHQVKVDSTAVGKVRSAVVSTLLAWVWYVRNY